MTRQTMVWLMVVVVLAMVLLVACGGDDPLPEDDPPILDKDSMPKEIATIALTATSTAVLEGGGETVNVAQPTATTGPPRPTATLTPYVGLFLGQSTSESGEDVPDTVTTLAPYVISPGGGGPVTGGINPAGGGACNIPVAAAFGNAYVAVRDRLGCPLSGGLSVQMVTQPFERGDMYWRDTRQIYALASTGQFWQVADGWNESMPADDPAFSPPGGLLQPVRGFGLAWRTNQHLRDALGWGTLPEAPYSSTWQDFENGAMFAGANNLIYAIFTTEGQHSGPLSP